MGGVVVELLLVETTEEGEFILEGVEPVPIIEAERTKRELFGLGGMAGVTELNGGFVELEEEGREAKGEAL